MANSYSFPVRNGGVIPDYTFPVQGAAPAQLTPEQQAVLAGLGTAPQPLDMDNERRYLEGLMQTGNPGQADWARQQAKAYGLGDLGLAPVRQGMTPGSGQQGNPQLLAGIGTGGGMPAASGMAQFPGVLGDIGRWQAANPIQPVFKPGTKFLSRETAEVAQARQAEQDKYQAEQDRQTATRQAERDKKADEQWAKSFGLQQSQESRLSKPGTLSPKDVLMQRFVAGETLTPNELKVIGAYVDQDQSKPLTEAEIQEKAIQMAQKDPGWGFQDPDTKKTPTTAQQKQDLIKLYADLIKGNPLVLPPPGGTADKDKADKKEPGLWTKMDESLGGWLPGGIPRDETWEMINQAKDNGYSDKEIFDALSAEGFNPATYGFR